MEWLNPWWEREEWHKDDKHLRWWSQQRYRWIPLWVKEFKPEPPALYFLFGPRQVGKTTAVKLLVKRLIDEGMNPMTITYVDLEIFPDWESFGRWLKEYSGPVTAERFLILDEVTSVPGWWRPLKALIDAGRMDKVTVLATGSSSAILAGDAERFFGRRGKGKNIEMLPLTFVDFKRVTGGPFREYMNWGGFPRAVNRDKEFFPELLNHLKVEVINAGKSPKLAFEILAKVVEKAPSATSYHAIATDLGVSHKTVREYVEFMEGLGVLRVIEQWGKGRFRKEKKIIMRDPAYPRALEILGVKISEAALFEWIVQEHVARVFGKIFFKQKNGEVDVVFDGEEVEIKLNKEGKNVVNLQNVEEFLEKIVRPAVEPA
ncbi:MAG: ATP-binding protein [Candidatus Diapherotrites archaeon]|nr:ATP-binding protein [Candidatus Diapherotrites archaeon]